MSKLIFLFVILLSPICHARPKPVTHSHNGRSHTHVLPNNGVGQHNHNSGQQKKENPSSSKDNYPETVREAADIIISKLKAQSKLEIISKSKKGLIMYHHGWGTRIRNSFGLWKGNKKLLSDCGGVNTHPDSCSMRIIEEVWNTLRESYPKEKIQKLDYINASLQEIIIPGYPEKNTGAIEYVAYLNSEISKSKYSGKFRIFAKCTSSHYRLKDFSNDNSMTLYQALNYFRAQMLAKIDINSNIITLKPLPFLGSKKCNT